MKKIDLGQTMQILANIGVIAGIVFLAIETRQNNEAVGLQVRLERADVRRQAVMRRVDNPAVVTATVKALQGEPLTAEDSYVLHRENVVRFVNWSIIFNDVQAGLLDESTIPLTVWRRDFHGDYPLMADSWEEQKIALPPNFVAWMESHVIAPGSP